MKTMSEDKEVINDQTVDEDKTEENEYGDEQQPEGKVEDKRLLSAIVQKEVERAKRLKLERELEELKSKLEKPQTTQQQTTVKDDSVMAEIEKLKFTQRHPDVDVSLVDDIYDYAKSKGKTLDEVLDSPIIKPYIEKNKEQKAMEGAIPTGNRSPIAVDNEKKEEKELISNARITGSTEDWAKVVERRLNKI